IIPKAQDLRETLVDAEVSSVTTDHRHTKCHLVEDAAELLFAVTQRPQVALARHRQGGQVGDQLDQSAVLLGWGARHAEVHREGAEDQAVAVEEWGRPTRTQVVLGSDVLEADPAWVGLDILCDHLGSQPRSSAARSSLGTDLGAGDRFGIADWQAGCSER